MKRFFVLMRDAARLIVQTAAIGESGKTYVLKAGEQVKIDLLARDLISLYGLQPDKDIKVEYTGLREGEELGERLVGENERLIETAFERIRIVEQEKDGGNVIEHVSVLLDLVSGSAGREEVINTLKMIVPSYRSTSRES
jgi:FlaA1/EpsC-like NDP-sugar epimerase